ncbi:VOC family protein [Actinocorallia aurantiaca]|uniref:VOC family protein n=1 Tax=Actinocorallia aurantiaca TaxID=46204 RepID=A0ABN3UN84_9ACTN
MPRHDVPPPGTPCWVELSSGDPGEAARFYGALFGWRLEHEEYEGYGRFLLDGKIAAGLWPEETSGAAASWTVYFTVEDVEASVDLVRDAGGQVVVEPRELDGQGTLAGCLDPEGVFFMLWKSANWGCTELLGRPGCWGWTELFTRDPERAEDFYPRVFGWGRSREGDRVRWTAEGQIVGGMLPLSPEAPAEALSAWVVHFAATDVWEAAERAEAMGAVRIKQLHDPIYGPAIILTDPQHAHFVLIPAPPKEARGRFPLIFR